MVPGGEIWGRLSFFPLWHRIRLENSYALAIEMRPDPVSPVSPAWDNTANIWDSTPPARPSEEMASDILDKKAP